MPFPTVDGRSFFDYVADLQEIFDSVPILQREKATTAISALFTMVDKVSTQQYHDVQQLKVVIHAIVTEKVWAKSGLSLDDPSQVPIVTQPSGG